MMHWMFEDRDYKKSAQLGENDRKGGIEGCREEIPMALYQEGQFHLFPKYSKTNL